MQYNEKIFDKREFLLNGMENRQKIVPAGIGRQGQWPIPARDFSYMFYVLKSVEKSKYLKSYLKLN